MQQTLLTLGALACLSVLSLNSRRMVHSHADYALHGDVEARLTELGDRLLDAGEDIPFTGTGSLTAATGTVTTQSLRLGFPAALDAWDDQTTAVSVDGPLGGMTVRVVADVQPVVKQGTRFVETTSATPMRMVRLTLSGPMQVSMTLERLYVQTS